MVCMVALEIKKLDGYFEGHIQADSEVINLSESINKAEIGNSVLYSHIKDLPKWKLETIRKTCTLAINNNFQKKREVKYGNLPRGMNNKQLQMFFGAIRNKNAKIEFMLQFFFALRVGEIAKLEILQEHDIVKVHSDKTDKVYFLPLFEPIKSLIRDNPLMVKHTTNYLRKVFRRVCNQIGVNLSYGVSTTGKPLYLNTTHSLRHSAINRFAEVVNGDPYKVSMYSRHSVKNVIGVQSVYRYYSMDELKKDLEKCFTGFEDIYKGNTFLL